MQEILCRELSLRALLFAIAVSFGMSSIAQSPLASDDPDLRDPLKTRSGAETMNTRRGEAIAGVWLAEFPNGSDTIVLRVRRDTEGYHGIVRSSRWGDTDHELKLVGREGRTLSISAPSLNVTLQLTLNKGGTELSGSGTRGNRTVLLNFHRVDYTLPQNHHRAQSNTPQPKPARLFMDYFLTTLGYDESFQNSPQFEEAEAAANSLSEIFQVGDKSAMKISGSLALENLELFLVDNPENPVRGIVVYYYLQNYRDQVAGIPDLTVFKSNLPDPVLANDSLSRICIALTYREYIRSAKMQGLTGVLQEYSASANDYLHQLMIEYPDDPYQVVAIDFYGANAVYEGGNAVVDAHTILKSIVTSYPNTLMAWASRYSIAKLSRENEFLVDESQSQYGLLLAEFETNVVQDALASSSVVPDVKCVIETLRAHALYGTGKVKESIVAYTTILEKYEDSANRDVVAFSRAKAQHVQSYADPGAATDGYEEYLAEFPVGDYSDEAYYRLGETLEKSGQLLEAQKAYEKVVRQFPTSPRAKASQEKQKSLEKKIRP